MHIQRAILKEIFSGLKPNKVSLLLGARRTGKTYLLKEIIKEYKGKCNLLNGEDLSVSQILSERTSRNYKRLFQGYDLLVIDEAQIIPLIGKSLKLMVDTLENIRIIASGSSSFDLINITGEPLTGRSNLYFLHPIAQHELNELENPLEVRQNLEDRILFGHYPEVINIEKTEDKKDYLFNLMNAYLLKDILMLDGIRNASKMFDLLRLISYQVGQEVSYNELGNKLGLNKNTIEKYLDLLTKVYVIFRVGGYGGNLRKEVTKNSKWYFCDTGVRNAVIGDFRPLTLRQDVGNLWENYLLIERMKRNMIYQKHTRYFFWRTYDGQEIDLIEEYEGEISAFEFKWKKEKWFPPIAFAKAYPKVMFATINRENYLEWVS